MKKSVKDKILLAQKLLDKFLLRTGITNNSGDVNRRYLWTDAFAVQSCFALSYLLNNKSYHHHALQLIEQVHNTLGKHRDDDSRTGWISGLPSEEGKNHPTINGLRIGKNLPERRAGEVFNQQLEWERDGQYFHYLTRWFNALLHAFNETGEKKYNVWAIELIKAGEKFVINRSDQFGMVWKMNIGLTQPVVESMGAHDPLEALICIYKAENTDPTKKAELMRFQNSVETICHNMNWFTNDPLGIGGLFLSVKRSMELVLQGEVLPAAIRPGYLFAAARAGLKAFAEQAYDKNQPEAYRLAFRECGMTLGVNTFFGMKDNCEELSIDINSLESYIPLSNEITEFWSEPASRSTTNWYMHQDINAVMFASSLLAEFYPKAF